MEDDLYDDGLVHSHNWATEKPSIVASAPAPQIAGEDEFDDGLVHGHDWAVSGK